MDITVCRIVSATSCLLVITDISLKMCVWIGPPSCPWFKKGLFYWELMLIQWKLWPQQRHPPGAQTSRESQGKLNIGLRDPAVTIHEIASSLPSQPFLPSQYLSYLVPEVTSVMILFIQLNKTQSTGSVMAEFYWNLSCWETMTTQVSTIYALGPKLEWHTQITWTAQ